MQVNTKTHTDISVTDNSTDVTVYAPDPQIRQNYDAFVKYIRDLELKMRGYDTNEDTGPKPIASYRTAGKTNEDTDRDVLKDLTGNGHDIVLKNFSYSLGSGYGLYKIDWSSKDWSNHLNGIRAEGTFTSSKIHITKVKISNANFFENVTISPALKYKVKVSGLKDNGILSYVYYSSTKPTVFRIQQDGVYDLPSSTYETKYQMGWRLVFSGESVDVDITIEQIPEYEGALVFDGVDDHGICENFPILTREQGYTLVAKRIYFEKKESSCFLSNRTVNIPNNNAFNMEITIRSHYGTRSFSAITQNVLSYPDLLTYQTTKQFNDTMITTKEQNEIGTNTVYLGTLGNSLEYIFNGAFYALDIYDRTLEGEELQTALNNIEK